MRMVQATQNPLGTRPRASRAGTVWLAILLPVIASGLSQVRAQPTSVQHSSAVPPGWDTGFDLFVSLLENQGLRHVPVSQPSIQTMPLDQLMPDPRQSVVVLTGNIPDLNGGRLLHRFLSRGGRVVIATDRSLNISGFCRIQAGDVQDSRNAWQSHADCVVVQPGLLADPLIYGVNQLVTNRPAWVASFEQSRRYRWSPLAQYSATATPVSCRGKPVWLVANIRGNTPGQLIVLADDSPLTNGMLWHGENQLLLLNLVNELCLPERTELLFLHDDQPIRSRVMDLLAAEAAQLDIPPAVIPPEALKDLPAEALLSIGNAVLTDLEDSDIANSMVADRPRQTQPRPYRRALLFAFCGVALAVFVYRSWRGSHAPLSWSRTPEPPAPSNPPAAHSVRQAASALARDACRLLTGKEDPQLWSEQLNPHGSVYRQLVESSDAPQSTRRALSEILDRATERQATAMSRSQLEFFGQQIYDLRQLNLHEQPAAASQVVKA